MTTRQNAAEIGETWLGKRVRVWPAFDIVRETRPMAEGTVCAYADAPTITVTADDGTQSSWMVTLPIDVLGEVPLDEIPAPAPRSSGHRWHLADAQLTPAEIGGVPVILVQCREHQDLHHRVESLGQALDVWLQHTEAQHP